MSVIANLSVKLTADVSELGAGMTEAAKSIEETAGKLKGIGEEVGKVGLLLSAGIGGALALMAERSEPAKKLMDGFKDASVTLADEVVTAVTPALEALLDVMKMGIGVLQEMDPETKSMVGTLAALTAGAGMAVGAIGQFSGVISGVVKGFQLLAGVMSGSVLLSIGAIVIGIAGVILIVGAMKDAWDNNLLGVQDAVKGIKTVVMSAFSAVVQAVQKSIEFIRSSIVSILGYVKQTIDKLTAVAPESMKGIGQAMSDAVSGAISVLEEPSTLKKVASDVLDMLTGFASQAGADIGATWKKGLEATGITTLIEKFEGMMGGLKQSGANAKLRDYDQKLEDPNKKPEAAKDKKKVEDPMEKFRPSNVKPQKLFSVSASVANVEKLAGTAPTAPTRINALSIAGFNADSKWQKMDKEAFDKFAEEARKADEELLSFGNRVKEAGAALANGLLAGTPIEGLMNAAQSGAESMVKAIGEGANAGPIGAVIAIVIELLKKSEAFGEIISVVTDLLGILANGLGAIIQPVVGLVSALYPLFDAVAAMLAPIGLIVDAALKPLIPILVMLGMMLEPLAPVIEVLAQLIAGIVNLVYAVLNPVLDGLFNTFRMLGMGFVFLAKGLAWAWNGIIEGVAGFLDMIGLTDLAAGARTMKVDTSGLDEKFAQLSTATEESTAAVAANAAQQHKQTDAAKEATAALLNVPKGFKVALARFNAASEDASVMADMAGAGGGGGGGDFGTSRGGLGSAGGGTTAQSVVVNIYGTQNGEEVWKQVRRAMERDNFRRGRGLIGTNPALSQ